LRETKYAAGGRSDEAIFGYHTGMSIFAVNGSNQVGSPVPKVRCGGLPTKAYCEILNEIEYIVGSAE
jgi:hypothetical protein